MGIFKRFSEYLLERSPLPNFNRYSRSDTAVATALLMVRAYYFFILFISAGLLSSWNPSFGAQSEAVTVWPLFWLPYVDFDFTYTAIRVFFIATSALVAFVPQWRFARILSFMGLLGFVSLYLTILQLDVDGYGLLLVSFSFIFLPNRWDGKEGMSDTERQRTLLIFWEAQAITLLTYTMGGIGKLVGAWQQIFAGDAHFFSPKASALLIADRLVLTDSVSAWGAWAIQHYWIVWPYFLFTLYLLLFSVVAAFRPELHRPWGLFLILFHLGNYLVINIAFATHIFLLAILLLASPFSPQKSTFREIVRSIPCIGILIRRIWK